MNIVMSKLVRFCETRSYTLPSDDESTWHPDPIGEPPVPVRDKIVYVFSIQKVGKAPPSRTARAQLERAIFVDNEIAMRIVSASDVKRQGGLGARESIPISPGLSLPDEIGDTQCFYYFYASRIELGPRAIATLEGNAARLLPPNNLPDDNVSSDNALRFVPVVDPITVAELLQRDFEDFADRVVLHQADVIDAPSEARAAARRRGARLVLGRFLEAIFDADRDNELKIDEDERATARAAIDGFLRNDKAALEALVSKREQLGVRLGSWLGSSIWQFLESSYREQELAVYDRYITALAEVSFRLIESSAGKAYFAAFQVTNRFVTQEYLVRDTPLAARFSVWRKCIAAGLSLLKDLVPFLLLGKDAEARDKAKWISSILNNAAGKPIVALEYFGRARIPTRVARGVVFIERELDGLTRTEIPADELEVWVRANKTRVNIVGTLIDAVNLAINLQKLLATLDKPNAGREALLASIKAVGSASSVAKAFAGVLEIRCTTEGQKLANRFTRGSAGFISATVDIVFGLIDGINAISRKDWAAAVGNSFIVAGSVISLIAAIMTLAGSAKAGLISFIAACVVMLGVLIVDLLSDSDFQSFVKHCVYGRNHLGADFTPSYSATNVMTWTDDDSGLRNQLDALYNLIAVFEVRPIGPRAIRIDIGDVPMGGKLRVDFRCVFDRNGTPLTLAPSLEIEPWTNRVIVLGQSSANKIADLKATHSQANGRQIFELDVDWPDGVPPAPPNTTGAPVVLETTDVEVRLDLFGDQSTLIPPRRGLHGRTFLKPAPLFDAVFNSTRP